MPGSATVAALVGGPLDGRIVPAVGGEYGFAWLDARGRMRLSRSDGHRWLYRVAGGRWRFVGHGARQCPGCGGVVDPEPATGGALPSCPLCGARLP